MSGVAPGSTTHELAKDVPLEKANGTAEANGSAAVPGAFPETPATEPAAFSVNPIPATEGAGNPIHLEPGEKVPDPSTLTSNTVSSTVHDDMTLAKSADEPEPTFAVAPIPATAGPGNPVHVGAGEGLPAHSEITGNTIESTVTTDKASYEAADAGPPVLPPVVTPEAERDEKGTGIFNLPPVSKNMIPESSLPMGVAGAGALDVSPMIQSVGPQSTTAQLAANVPLEPRAPEVPEIVKESQKEAGFEPEASGVPEEVREKAEVEKELLNEVPEAPATSTDETGAAKSAGATVAETGAAVGAAALAVGGAAAAYATSAKDKVTEAVGQASESDAAKTTTSYVSDAKDKVAATTASAADTATSAVADGKDKLASTTGIGATSFPSTAAAAPEMVKESIAQSGQSPEAAAFTEPVAEKKAVENELLSEVKPEQSTGEPAPKIADTAATSAPAEAASTAAAAPEIVKESIAEAGASPEAAAYKEPVAEKTTMEKELLSEVKKEEATGEPAPKAEAPEAATLSPPVTTPQLDSRDVSPTTIPGSHKHNAGSTIPTVTTGVASGKTQTASTAPSTPGKPVTSTTPGSSKANDTPATSSPATVEKKKKRFSGFFGKLKEKLK